MEAAREVANRLLTRMWEAPWGYVTVGSIFLLLALSQVGQWRHDQSDVRPIRLVLAVVLGALSLLMLVLLAWNHWL